MAEDRIIAVGLLTTRDVTLLGPSFERLWPVEEAHSFSQLLKAIDEADRQMHSDLDAAARANGSIADSLATLDASIPSKPNVAGTGSAFKTHDADYFRARAMEERGHAESADRVYLALIHKELARLFDRRADECDGITQAEALAERAAERIE